MKVGVKKSDYQEGRNNRLAHNEKGEPFVFLMTELRGKSSAQSKKILHPSVAILPFLPLLLIIRLFLDFVDVVEVFIVIDGGAPQLYTAVAIAFLR